MRETMDMTKKELAVFSLMAVLSGFMIGIGGTASLLANSLLGVWGRLVGALAPKICSGGKGAVL